MYKYNTLYINIYNSFKYSYVPYVLEVVARLVEFFHVVLLHNWVIW